MKTFKCNFGKALTCTIHVSETLPKSGEPHIQKTEWSHRPTPAVIRPYIAWINSVNQQLSDEWGIKISHIFQIPGGFEIWNYNPGENPKKQFVENE